VPQGRNAAFAKRGRPATLPGRGMQARKRAPAAAAAMESSARKPPPRLLPLLLPALLLAAAPQRATAVHGTGCGVGRPCANNGTCELNTGQCNCYPGYAGPSCETLLFPACRVMLEPHANGFPHAMRCFMGAELKSCECHRQCWKHELIKFPGWEVPMPCYDRWALAPRRARRARRDAAPAAPAATLRHRSAQAAGLLHRVPPASLPACPPPPCRCPCSRPRCPCCRPAAAAASRTPCDVPCPPSTHYSNKPLPSDKHAHTQTHTHTRARAQNRHTGAPAH